MKINIQSIKQELYQGFLLWIIYLFILISLIGSLLCSHSKHNILPMTQNNSTKTDSDIDAAAAYQIIGIISPQSAPGSLGDALSTAQQVMGLSF